MDATLKAEAGHRPPQSQPDQQRSALDDVSQVGAFAADAFKLAAHETRLALAGAATALVLAVAAAVGALVAVSLLVVATVFAFHALGLAWPFAFLATSVVIGLLCYLAFRRAGTLIHRLTLPVTRKTLQGEA